MAGSILLHAFRLIAGNLREVFRLTFFFGFISQFVLLWVFYKAISSTGVAEVLGLSGARAANLLLDLSAILVNLVLTSWLAVNWHRFILVQEYPTSVFPIWRSRLVLDYGLRVLQVVGLFLGLIVVGAVFSGVLGHLVHPIISPLLVALVFFIVTWLCLRLGIVLPAVAVELPFDLSKSWALTTKLSRALGLVSMVLCAAFASVNQILKRMDPDLFFELILRSVLSWAMLVFVITCLTTVYQVLVEGESISKA